jgi:hypothetical protein
VNLDKRQVGNPIGWWARASSSTHFKVCTNPGSGDA